MMFFHAQREWFSLGFQMKLPEGYCAKLYGWSGMTAKHGIHLPGGVSIIDEDFLGLVSLYLQNSDLSKLYKIKIGNRIAQMMIEKVQWVKWVEGTVDDFNIEETDVNGTCDCPAGKKIRNLKGYGSTGIYFEFVDSKMWNKTIAVANLIFVNSKA